MIKMFMQLLKKQNAVHVAVTEKSFTEDDFSTKKVIEKISSMRNKYFIFFP